MGQIYLVRHGQASFGSANYDQLSELGFEQARLLGQWYARRHRSFQRVVTGGMVRHRQTADTCLAELAQSQLPGTAWHTDDGFAEFDHHEVLLRHCPEFGDPALFKQMLARSAPQHPERALVEIFRAAMQRWMGGWHDDDYTETWPEFRRRCVAALERLDVGDSSDAASGGSAQDGHAAQGGQGQHATIVFTSGGVIATLMQHVLGLQDYQVVDLSWTLANCAVTKLLSHPGQFSLGYLNNYAHLEWLGQPGTVTYR